MPRPFPQLRHLIVQAPLGSGPSTPELTAAVSSVGGLGFLAAGYNSPAAAQADIARTRALTAAPRARFEASEDARAGLRAARPGADRAGRGATSLCRA